MTEPDLARVDVLVDALGYRPVNIVVNDEGMDTQVYDIDNAWIFRFAREAWMIPRLAAEGKLLDNIAHVLPAPVPRHVHRGPGFCGYRKIQGKPLTWDLHAALPPASRARLARELGLFLKALHAVPVAVAEACGIARDAAEGPEDAAAQAARFARVLAPVLPPALLESCLAFYPRHHAWAARNAAPTAVLHNDLILMTHVLVDPATGALAGVIDFGDAALGDPAIDLAAIALEMPEPFASAVFQAYGDATSGFRERARMHGLHYLLHDSIWMWEDEAGAHARERRLERIGHHFGHNRPPG